MQRHSQKSCSVRHNCSLKKIQVRIPILFNLQSLNIKKISQQKSINNEKELKEQENSQKESSQKQKQSDSKSLTQHHSNSIENEEEFNQT